MSHVHCYRMMITYGLYHFALIVTRPDAILLKLSHVESCECYKRVSSPSLEMSQAL